MKLRPSTEEREVQRLMDETTAARDMMDLHGAPSFSGIKPVGAALQRAELGGALNNRELLDIAAVLRTTRTVSAYCDGAEERNCLRPLFRALTPDRTLEEQHYRIHHFGGGDRRHGQLRSWRISAAISAPPRARSGRCCKSSSALRPAKYLQEADHHHARTDRFVVPVKAEYRGEIPGLVHDVSSTGRHAVSSSPWGW